MRAKNDGALRNIIASNRSSHQGVESWCWNVRVCLDTENTPPIMTRNLQPSHALHTIINPIVKLDAFPSNAVCLCHCLCFVLLIYLIIDPMATARSLFTNLAKIKLGSRPRHVQTIHIRYSTAKYLSWCVSGLVDSWFPCGLDRAMRRA